MPARANAVSRERPAPEEEALAAQRMLRLTGGAFVSASVQLGISMHPYFLWFTLFVGLNLFQSTFTNWCPMMSILRRAGVRDEGPTRRASWMHDATLRLAIDDVRLTTYDVRFSRALSSAG